jgi:hypothetical protein
MSVFQSPDLARIHPAMTEMRAALLAGLQRKLAQGDKALVGNGGYRRFLAEPTGGHFTIDPAKVETDAAYDGLFVLRSNSRLTLLQVVLGDRNQR